MTTPGPASPPPSAAVTRRLGEVLSRLFSSLESEAIERIAAQMDFVRLRRDACLFRQGDPGDSLYVVLTGRLQVVSREGPGPARLLNELASGESVGEMALITGEPRTADVVAIRDSDLARLSGDAFEAIVRQYPQVMQAFACAVIRWLRRKETAPPVPGAVRTIAVFASGDDSPAAEVAERLAAALAESRSTLHLRSDRIAALAGLPADALARDDGPHWPALADWLDRQELAHDVLLYQADPTPSPWTRLCLRQADVIVLVADFASGPGLGPNERLLAESQPAPPGGPRQWLVLVHPAGSGLPSGTAGYLRDRRAGAHCHVRGDCPSDFERLARLVVGEGLGLALSGGGARGLAHIGVLAALAEAGLRFDLVGGTSMGAIIGAMHAMGHSPERMADISRQAWIKSRPFRHYTLPLVSLFAGGKFDRIARMMFGQVCIEDLWTGYLCLSSDLSSTQAVVHQAGPLWQAVRASASMPGVAPPVIDGGHLLVDGGVLNNLPGDVVRAANCRRVLAVNVSPDVRLTTNCRQMPSTMRMLLGRLWPGKSRPVVPNILDILEGTTMLASRAHLNAVCQDADFCLRPPVTHFRMLQFDAIDQIIRIGYEHARSHLDAIRAALA